MTANTSPPDAEFAAMKAIYECLEPLDDDARARVVNYIAARLEIVTPSQTQAKQPLDLHEPEVDELLSGEVEAPSTAYATFAELYDAVGPKTNAERALVAGYWLQVCQAAGSFDGFSANKELKHLGQGLPNVTTAVDALKNMKPALALQLKKAGKSQQARKIYKITVAGVKAIEAMISG
jgi:hypothetical protein